MRAILQSVTYAFRFTILPIFALPVLVACSAPQPQRDFTGDPDFRTTQPSRLFFANVRASNYYLERPAGTELSLYRNRKFSQTSKRPILIPVIVQALLKDEAYLFIRPNDFRGLADPLTVAWSTDTSKGTYTLDVLTRPAQFDFATELYAALLGGQRLSVRLADSSYMPIFEDEVERAAFAVTTADYYRLTERI